MIKRSMGEVDMPGFQTKALVVMSISGDNLESSHPIVCLDGHMCSNKAEFSLLQRRPLFDALSNVYQTDAWSVQYTYDHSHCAE